MADIKLKVKLAAYSKGVIPDVSKYIEEAPEDGNLYARKDKQWESIEIPEVQSTSLIITKDGAIYNLETKEYAGPESGVTEWKEGWTYFITEDEVPEIEVPLEEEPNMFNEVIEEEPIIDPEQPEEIIEEVIEENKEIV